MAALVLEPRTEAVFHEDSYGYRPRKGALDAVAACRQRCRARNWVIDLDIRKFFDSVPWGLAVKAVEANVTHEQRWITLYVRRWLAAPVVMPGGRTEARDKGTPQGSCASPVLANLFMHYAFDKWLEREFPAVGFERYADDAVIHCATEQQARRVLAALEERMAEVGLQLHPDKTRIVYCKGQEPAAQRLRRHVVHLPGLHVPRQAGPGPAGRRRDVQRLPARGQQGRPQANERGSPRLAHPHAQRHRAGGHRHVDQPSSQRLDELLRQVLQDRAERPAPAHQHLPGALGETEVQAARVIQESPQVAGRADREAATPVCALGMDDRFQVQPIDGTSGVTGDCHAPFRGSPGVRFPRATRLRVYREAHVDGEPPLELSERARLRELERKNRELEMENAFLKKAAAYFAREQR